MEEELKYLQELNGAVKALFSAVDKISEQMLEIAKIQEKESKILMELLEKVKELTEN